MSGSGLVRFTCSGMHWQLLPDAAPLVREQILEQFPHLARLPGVEQVKQAVRRTVYRVPLSDGRRTIVKLYRLRSWRDRLKRLVLGGKPAIEWAASRRLLAMGLPASRAIAIGLAVDRRQELEGCLVIDAPPDVVSVGAFVATFGSPPDEAGAERNLEFIRELARLVRRLHEAGVSHHDLHGGNILVHPHARPPDERFLVIDLHRVHIGRVPSLRHRASSIAQLLRSRLSCERLRPQVPHVFLRAYLQAPPPLPSRLLEVDRIRQLMARQDAVRLRSRGKRCLLNTSQYTVDRAEGRRLYHLRQYSVAELLALLERHADELKGGHDLPACTEHPCDGHPDVTLEVREFPPRGALGRLLAGLVPSPGVSHYAAVHRRWVETRSGPRAAAAVECLRGERRGRSFAITELQANGPQGRGSVAES